VSMSTAVLRHRHTRQRTRPAAPARERRSTAYLQKLVTAARTRCRRVQAATRGGYFCILPHALNQERRKRSEHTSRVGGVRGPSYASPTIEGTVSSSYEGAQLQARVPRISNIGGGGVGGGGGSSGARGAGGPLPGGPRKVRTCCVRDGVTPHAPTIGMA